MCGVIKSPVAGAIASTQQCGVAKLNTYGCCVVLLPPEFPDPDIKGMTSSSSLLGRNVCSYAPFTVAYNLTPLGSAMPQLHVSTEVTRFSTSVWKSMGVSTSTGTGVSTSTGSNMDKKDTTSSSNIKTGTVQSERTSNCKENNSTSTSNSNSKINDSKNVLLKKKKGVPRFCAHQTEDAKIEEKEEKEEKTELETELEQNILRNYWAVNTKNLHHSGGKMSRSVSTGNIPALSFSPLRNAKSTGNFFNLHNDRLIDGPLLKGLGVLSGTGVLSATLSATAICQLARDESDNDDDNNNFNNFNTDNNNNNSNTNNIGKGKNGKNEKDITSSSSNSPLKTIPTTKTQPHTNNSKSNNNSKNNSDEKKFSSGIIPLCFTISGGIPLGRVSWMVTSLPIESSNSMIENDNGNGNGNENYGSSFGSSYGAGSSYGSSSISDIDQDNSSATVGSSTDWRAL